MLKKAVAYYHELLEDFDLAESSRQALDEGLEDARLIFGGRRLTPYLRPHFVTQADWNRTKAICETIWNALQKVKDAAIENGELLEELGITGIEKELVEIDPKYQICFAECAARFVFDGKFIFVCRTQRRISGGRCLRGFGDGDFYESAGDEKILRKIRSRNA